MLIVDAHPHIYSPDRQRYPTVPVPWEPGEPASAEDLKRKMDDAGVSRAVFIQTGTFYGWDNRYVMDSSRENKAWACGVVTLSPDDPTHLDILEEGVRNSNVRGLRGTPDSNDRISSPGAYRLWTKARDRPRVAVAEGRLLATLIGGSTTAGEPARESVESLQRLRVIAGAVLRGSN